jgi:MFS family permease
VIGLVQVSGVHFRLASFSHFRRNFVSLLGGSVGFFVGITFASTTTVLPLLVERLTGSAIAVGLLSTVSQGAWLLPQLIFANLLISKRRKKPHLLLGAALGRPVYLYYAIAFGLGLYHYPALAVVLLFGTQIAFYTSDALISVAWFDIVAKVVPANRRARLFGGGQLVSGVLAVGAGAIIAVLLGADGPPYPANYFAVLVLGGCAFIFGLLSWLFLVEPDEAVAEKRPAWRDFLPELSRTLLQDPALARLILVRLLAGFDGLVVSFYVLFATRELGLPPGSAGLFIAAQTVGRILGGVGLGALAERYGGHRVIQVGTAINMTAPLLGLALVLANVEGGATTALLFSWVFVTIGITISAVMLGFFNYTLELAPAGKRPIYIALLNTMSGLLILLPAIGGWVLQAASFGFLFGLTAVVLMLAHGLSYSLPARYLDTSSVGSEADV